MTTAVDLSTADARQSFVDAQDMALERHVVPGGHGPGSAVLT